MKGRIKNLTVHKRSLPAVVVLYVLPILLAIVGLIFVFESSSIRALSETGDSFYYLKLQIRWIILGVIAMTGFSLFPYKNWYYLSFPFMAAVIFMLVLVLIPGVGHTVNGARRWIDLGFFSIQPTEFAKLGTILYLSSWFSTKEKKKFLPFLTLIGGMMLLILLQPDMGTAIIIFSLSITLYFLAGRDLHYLVTLLPVALVGAVILIFAAPYRMRRFTAFLDPHSDPMGIGYHINQVMISLSNGGLLGSGFGSSRQKYLFLPEAHTDSIFAIYGEEFGFIGGVFLILVYLYFLYKIYTVHQNTSDTFGKLLTGGIFAFFGFQIITNLGGMTALMPMTGVPLPFISYGGSHILISFMLLGIALNVARSSRSS